MTHPQQLSATTEEEREALKSLARGCKSAVDIGTFRGGTAHCLLEVMPEGYVWTIDTFDGRSGGETITSWPREQLIKDVLNNLKEFDGRFALAVGESSAVSRVFHDRSIDLVFIDGAHDYNSVDRDIEHWIEKVREGGIICGHDYEKRMRYIPDECYEQHAHLDCCLEHNCHPGVIKAVDKWFELVKTCNSLWWTRL